MNMNRGIANNSLIIVLVVLGMSIRVGAQTLCYWTGADSTTNSWSSNANWSGSKPGYNSIAIFTNFPGGTPQNPDTYGAGRSNTGIDLQTAGWTIKDSVGTSSLQVNKQMRSLGEGVNIIESYIHKSSTAPLIVGTNNTLVFAGGAEFDGDGTAYLCEGGTVVFGGDEDRSGFYGRTMITNDFILYANVVQGFGTITVTNGTIGGTGGLNGWNSGTSYFRGSGKLSPGCDGVWGDEISSFTLKSKSSTTGHFYKFESGSSMEIQIGETLGVNDKVIFDSPSSTKLTIDSGVTLNLYGSSIEDGDYIVVEKTERTSKDLDGTFDIVNFNGELIDEDYFTVTYNGSNIVVSVEGMADPVGTVFIIE